MFENFSTNSLSINYEKCTFATNDVNIILSPREQETKRKDYVTIFFYSVCCNLPSSELYTHNY